MVVLRILLFSIAFQATAAARLKRLAKHRVNGTSACPANLQINTKGDCIESETYAPAPYECCDHIRACENDLDVMIGYQSDRLNQDLATCGLTPEDFRMAASGNLELIDKTKVCTPGCTSMAHIDWEEVVERCQKHLFNLAQQLKALASVTDSIEEALKACDHTEPSPSPTPAPTPVPTPAPPREYWSGTCSACPSSFHPGLHCNGAAEQIGERGCGIKVFGLHLGCEARCREPEVKEFWNGRCTFCPAAWYSHCPSGSTLIAERGCGVANVFCEGKCRING